MSRLRTAILGTAVWCGVVALVASLVWVVIDRAGQGVAPETRPQADVTGSLPVPGGERSSLSTSPGTTLSPRPSRRTTPSATGASSPVPVTPTPVAPTPQRRSWTGAAGHVVAECRGPTVALVSAFPGTGWRYSILDRGPTVVRVGFQRLGEDRFVTVSASCLAGVPRFLTSTAEPRDE